MRATVFSDVSIALQYEDVRVVPPRHAARHMEPW